jgi:hypothetical protein
MPIKELTSDEIDSLVGTRHPIAGIEYPPNGLQPYYQWLIRALHLLAESSFGALRVSANDSSDTSVQVAPGRASISDVVLDHPGQTLSLSSYNNDSAYIWLFNSTGTPAIGVGTDAAGWPGTPHLKLAKVTIVAGQITQIVDRRIEQALSV